MLIINADDQALHGAIVSVMDEVRLAGVSRLAIAVSLTEGAPMRHAVLAPAFLTFCWYMRPVCWVCRCFGIATFPHGTFRSHSG